MTQLGQVTQLGQKSYPTNIIDNTSTTIKDIYKEKEPSIIKEEKSEKEIEDDITPGHKRFLENLEKNYPEPPEERSAQSTRAAIFWFAWEFAMPKYISNEKDFGRVQHLVAFRERFLDLLIYIPWFIIYENDKWLRDTGMLKTINGLALRIDRYHKISRKDTKWLNARNKMRDTVKTLKDRRPKLYQYLMKLKVSLNTSGG